MRASCVLATVALLVSLLFSIGSGSSQAAPVKSAAPPASADTLYARQDWPAAMRAYQAITKRDPSLPRAWYRLGVCYAALQRWPDAIAADHRAEALSPTPQFARYNLACAFARAGQADSAFAALDRLGQTGYSQPEQLLAEADLASVRGDSRFLAVVARAKHAASPCMDAAESRQLDFWIGDWDVLDNRSGQQPAGASHVELILGDCVILENWTGVRGGSGKSFNAWNREKSCWQQSWVDDKGALTNYTDGQYRDGAMVYLAEQKAPDGKPVRLRMSFFNLAPGQVRQLGEQSTDSGTTWAMTFDLNYVRRK